MRVPGWRWSDARREIEAAMATVTGDSLAAAAAIAYLGPFDEAHRQGLYISYSQLTFIISITSNRLYQKLLKVSRLSKYAQVDPKLSQKERQRV